jgi:hypothetical protein
VNKCLHIHHRFPRKLLAAGAAAALVLAGCGSDDAESDDATADTAAESTATADTTATPADTTAETTADTTAETTGDTAAGSGDNQTVCDNLIELDQTVPTGQATPEEANAGLDEAIAAADEETAALLTDFQTALQPVLDDPEGEPSDEFFGQYSAMLSWVGENCDVETLDVTAEDYHFVGIPEELAGDYYIVNFVNDGNEPHELGVARINDDVALSVDELLALPEEESDTMIEFIGGMFAMPGESSVGSLTLTDPGRFVAACSVPIGTTADAEGTGAPHFTQGMAHEFTVS